MFNVKIVMQCNKLKNKKTTHSMSSIILISLHCPSSPCCHYNNASIIAAAAAAAFTMETTTAGGDHMNNNYSSHTDR